MNLSRFGKGMFRTLSLVRDQAYSFHPRDVLSGGKGRNEKHFWNSALLCKES